MTLFSLLLAVEALNAKELWVAPTGSDSNAGTRDAPFATWARALVASRASSKPMTVVFRAGTYPLNATIVLTPEDSGTTFRSALGEKVHFRSGAALSGWRFLKPSDRGYGSLPPASRPHVRPCSPPSTGPSPLLLLWPLPSLPYRLAAVAIAPFRFRLASVATAPISALARCATALSFSALARCHCFRS